MQTLTTEELTRWLDAGDRVVLIDASARAHFLGGHLPGALNVPPDAAALVDAVAAAAPDTRHTVVVYSANGTDATQVAQRLEQAGFQRVFVYPDGAIGYARTGRPLLRVAADGRPERTSAEAPEQGE